MNYMLPSFFTRHTCSITAPSMYMLMFGTVKLIRETNRAVDLTCRLLWRCSVLQTFVIRKCLIYHIYIWLFWLFSEIKELSVRVFVIYNMYALYETCFAVFWISAMFSCCSKVCSIEFLMSFQGLVFASMLITYLLYFLLVPSMFYWYLLTNFLPSWYVLLMCWEERWLTELGCFIME